MDSFSLFLNDLNRFISLRNKPKMETTGPDSPLKSKWEPQIITMVVCTVFTGWLRSKRKSVLGRLRDYLRKYMNRSVNTNVPCVVPSLTHIGHWHICQWYWSTIILNCIGGRWGGGHPALWTMYVCLNKVKIILHRIKISTNFIQWLDDCHGSKNPGMEPVVWS